MEQALARLVVLRPYQLGDFERVLERSVLLHVQRLNALPKSVVTDGTSKGLRSKHARRLHRIHQRFQMGLSHIDVSVTLNHLRDRHRATSTLRGAILTLLISVHQLCLDSESFCGLLLRLISIFILIDYDFSVICNTLHGSLVPTLANARLAHRLQVLSRGISAKIDAVCADVIITSEWLDRI